MDGGKMLSEGLHKWCETQEWNEDFVHYVPFIGADYFDGLRIDGLRSRVRLLLVGESHYEDEGLTPKESREYTLTHFGQFVDVGKDLSEDKTFFRRIGALPTLNEAPEREEVAKTWRCVAFTNFLQGSVGGKAADRPTGAHWKNGEPALKEIVNRLQPDTVLFVSKSVWNRVECGRYVEGVQINAERTPRRLWLMPHGTGDALCTWVYHPSWNFETQTSRINVLSELLLLAEKRKAEQSSVVSGR